MSRSTGIVLVHGSQNAGDCWDLTVAEIERRSPDTPVLAIDLPGRRSVPADLSKVTVADWVDSAVAQIEAADLDRFIIVGHSMAGITVPGVVARFGPDRVRRMVLISAAVPPQGSSILAILPTAFGWLTRRNSATGTPAPPLPRLLARWLVCNRMTAQQRAFTLARSSYRESSRVLAEPVDRSGLSAAVPRTWILTLHDRVQSVARQRRAIDALGGVEEVIEMDTGHTAMVAEPAELAEILLRRL